MKQICKKKFQSPCCI